MPRFTDSVTATSDRLRYDFPQFMRGDTFTLTVTYTQDGDLTGASITATFRDENDAVVFTRRNAAAGGGATEINITVAASGIFVVYIVPANTTGLLLATGETRRLSYDVQLTTSGSAVRTVLQGYLRVTGAATR